MDVTLTLLFWSGIGVIVAGLIGNTRGKMGTGMVLGLLFGPILGAIFTMLAIRGEPASRP